jgi:hypothetical protein
MLYAKINNTTVIEFPYSINELCRDNPNTSYDDRYSVSEWFSKTEAAESSNDRVVEVEILQPPSNITEGQFVVRDPNPSLNANGQWVLGWSIRTQATVAPTVDAVN